MGMLEDVAAPKTPFPLIQHVLPHQGPVLGVQGVSCPLKCTQFNCIICRAEEKQPGKQSFH